MILTCRQARTSAVVSDPVSQACLMKGITRALLKVTTSQGALHEGLAEVPHGLRGFPFNTTRSLFQPDGYSGPWACVLHNLEQVLGHFSYLCSSVTQTPGKSPRGLLRIRGEGPHPELSTTPGSHGRISSKILALIFSFRHTRGFYLPYNQGPDL